ncbi:hypothetical protein ACX84Z_30980, partial [Burkholderia pseudomallei]
MSNTAPIRHPMHEPAHRQTPRRIDVTGIRRSPSRRKPIDPARRRSHAHAAAIRAARSSSGTARSIEHRAEQHVR